MFRCLGLLFTSKPVEFCSSDGRRGHGVGAVNLARSSVWSSSNRPHTISCKWPQNVREIAGSSLMGGFCLPCYASSSPCVCTRRTVDGWLMAEYMVVPT